MRTGVLLGYPSMPVSSFALPSRSSYNAADPDTGDHQHAKTPNSRTTQSCRFRPQDCEF